MMNQLKQPKNTEEQLKSMKFEIAENFRHEHELRRSLLNSGFFHSSWVIRWKKRLELNGAFSMTLAMSSILGGIILAFLFQFAVLGTMQMVEKEKSSSVKFAQEDAKELLQTMYEQGQLQYARQENDGTRVYHVVSHGHAEVEIRDKQPYVINLVSVNQ